MKTYLAKQTDIKRNWYLADATDKILGRLASKVATVLRGKHKVVYTPNIDSGDFVIVINAAKIKLSGTKVDSKLYRRYSGYPGGLKVAVLADMLEKHPTEVVALAVRKMLPQGPLGRKLFRKFKVYADDKFPHTAQKPKVLEV